MNMHTERQEVMLMTQGMVMFLLDLELKHFPGRMLTLQHTSQPLTLDDVLSQGFISSCFVWMLFPKTFTYILVRKVMF